MKSQYIIFIIILFVFITLVDLYTFRGLRKISVSFNTESRIILTVVFWLITGIAFTVLIALYALSGKLSQNELFRWVTFFFGFFLLFYLPKLVFVLFQFFNDVYYLIADFFSSSSSTPQGREAIKRADFLLQLGVIIATIPFLGVLHGITHGRYNYKVQKVRLNFPNLPEEFEGTSFVQISDLHLGSFNEKTKYLKKAVDLVNSLKPDYILFTGDMVNNIADEMEPYVPLLRELTAKSGKYSILGNHDYGEYYNWGSDKAREANMRKLVELQENAGFRLLRNEAVRLIKGNAEIALAGVENWGIEPFPQFGDLKKALSDVKDIPFKILMTHDPSHWDAKVRTGSDVNLTLSGHTHGMQFAISIPGWRWSPVKLKYPRWSGIYQEGKQILYVNIGLGFIAFPGRVGTPPEITFFELGKTKNK